MMWLLIYLVLAVLTWVSIFVVYICIPEEEDRPMKRWFLATIVGSVGIVFSIALLCVILGHPPTTPNGRALTKIKGGKYQVLGVGTTKTDHSDEIYLVLVKSPDDKELNFEKALYYCLPKSIFEEIPTPVPSGVPRFIKVVKKAGLKNESYTHIYVEPQEQEE